MKHLIYIALAFFLSLVGFGQVIESTNDTLLKELDDSLLIKLISIKSEIQINKNEIKKLDKRTITFQNNTNSKLNHNKSQIDSLIAVVKEDVLNLRESSNQLGKKIKITEENSNTGLKRLEHSITKNTYFWILCFVVAIFLSVGIFLLLRRKIQNSGSKLTNEIEETRKKLEEEGIKLDNKLLELLEKQLTVSQAQNQINQKETETDHSLALKVADEIVRIQKNLSKMDDSVKGIKQLSASVERIRSNFEANGYEIVDMLNKPYNDGMKVQANFRPDDTLEEGVQIITRIIKPQVNYGGVMIQSAQIEVSQG